MMDDFPLLPPPQSETMDEALALTERIDGLCKLAMHIENLKNSAARMRLIEAMDVVLGTMRPAAKVVDISVPPSLTGGEDA